MLLILAALVDALNVDRVISGSATSRVCDVRVRVRALKEKRLELSTPNLSHIYSIAGSQHSLTPRSRVQSLTSQGYEVCTLPALVGLHVDTTAIGFRLIFNVQEIDRCREYAVITEPLNGLRLSSAD